MQVAQSVVVLVNCGNTDMQMCMDIHEDRCRRPREREALSFSPGHHSTLSHVYTDIIPDIGALYLY